MADQWPIPPAATNAQGVPSSSAGTVFFLGASYSAGWGATDANHHLPQLVANALHRSYRVDAAAGTGFVTATPHAPAYPRRLIHQRRDVEVGLVVVQGGRNDAGRPIDLIDRAAAQTLRLCQSRFPRAHIVLLGPIPGVLPADASLSSLDTVLRHAARTAGVKYVDAMTERWMTPTNLPSYTGRVPAHPNDAGYRYIAARLVREL